MIRIQQVLALVRETCMATQEKQVLMKVVMICQAPQFNELKIMET